MEMSTKAKERNEAFFSLDKNKIEAYLKKYNIPRPQNELVFWAGIYKAILVIPSAPDDLVLKSKWWLKQHNFKEGIF
ncbi:MAG: hypothetical protein AB7E42_00180 [Anaerotignaceae bacterium]